ncbi:MAG: VanZ family protein [Clostridia bacterium]|nr:VanZ family protein [Clostridia bacterium]
MEQTVNKGRLHVSLRLFALTALLVLVYGFIFSMSAQDGVSSGGLSGKIAALFVPRGSEYFDLFHLLVRKSAHVAEFLLLFGLWFGWTDEAFPGAESPLALGLPYGATLLSAIGDELHQLSVPGRSGQFTDVMIDMLGVTVAALILLAFRQWKRSRLPG